MKMTLYEEIKQYDIKQMAAFLVGMRISVLRGIDRVNAMNDESLEKQFKRMIETLSEEE
jgi:hypothetical protein